MLEVQATIRLALIYAARDESERGRELLKSLEAKIHIPALLREIQNAQALLSIRSGEDSSLEWWEKIISAEDQNTLSLQKEREAFTLARLRIAENKTEEALNMIKQWQADSVQNGRVRSQVEALILEALAHRADSNLSQTTQLLGEALAIGHAKGFQRMFLDEGPPMVALLQAVPSALPNRTLNLFAATLLHSFSPDMVTRNDSSPLVEPLSQQELKVLRLLAAGLSNAEIASELVVSANTIKTHVKSIYRKLNVNSRQDAREVAKELKLV
jgi:LuxR family maltose regulon positive regulatory protein